MVIDEKYLNETKAEFNERYGRWLRECREEKNMTLAQAAAITGIVPDTLRKLEDGVCIELNDAIRLWHCYDIDGSTEL